ncbi:MAG: inositol monophosphatase [Stappiaceae bacterium]
MQNDLDLSPRFTLAEKLARQAGATALDYFRKRKQLEIESKGSQDFVTVADRAVEKEIRSAIEAAWPDDGILGEEDGIQQGKNDICWVIDPIDGTANFVSGIPEWCVVIAGCVKGVTEFAVIHNPNSGETFSARRGEGAYLNGEKMQVSSSRDLSVGSTGVGTSGRMNYKIPISFMDMLMARQGIFYRNQSGALMLAYVADGRLIGYYEENMNSWDCFRALLMIEEAGGRVHPFNSPETLTGHTRVIAGAPGVYDAIAELAERAVTQAKEPVRTPQS